MSANTIDRTITVLSSTLGRTDYDIDVPPNYVTLVDIDGDRDLDIITANAIAPGCSMLLNRGDGTFGTQIDYDVRDAWEVALADLNGDGWLDLVTSTVNVLLAIR